jgi:hypothetical protein
MDPDGQPRVEERTVPLEAADAVNRLSRRAAAMRSAGTTIRTAASS